MALPTFSDTFCIFSLSCMILRSLIFSCKTAITEPRKSIPIRIYATIRIILPIKCGICFKICRIRGLANLHHHNDRRTEDQQMPDSKISLVLKTILTVIPPFPMKNMLQDQPCHNGHERCQKCSSYKQEKKFRCRSSGRKIQHSTAQTPYDRQNGMFIKPVFTNFRLRTAFATTPAHQPAKE